MKLVLALTVLALPSQAADLFVGPGHPYADIQPAIDAAQRGDRIFVSPGLYQPFDLAKPLEIRGAGPGSTQVTSFVPGVHTKVRNTPAGTVATLAGISFYHSDPTAQTNNALVAVTSNAGSVVLQELHVGQVLLAYPLSGPGVLVANSQRVFVQKCLLRGFPGSFFGGVGHPALDAENASLWISDSRLEAGHASGGQFTFGAPGAAGLLLRNGDAQLARAIVRGGTGSYDAFQMSPSPGGPGVAIADGSLVVVGGPTLVTGPTNQITGGKGTWDGNLNSQGGPGIELLGTSTAQVSVDAVVQGGLDGIGVVPSVPYAYSPGSTVTLLAHRLPSVVLSAQAVAIGSSLTLEFAGNPTALVVPMLSAGLGAPLALGGIEGIVHVDLVLSSVLGAATIGANSLGSKVIPVPADPALLGAHAWFQTGELFGGVLRVSNAARVGIAP